MKKDIHRASERGTTEAGWLHSKHSFNFGNYYNPYRMGFGTLLVLNDDTVEPGQGFGTHHHENMEIISIVLEGALEHKDSMGGHGIIKANEIQVISAGSGIDHSEFNHSKTKNVKFFQIWIEPKERNLKPRHNQKKFLPKDRKNRLQVVVSGNKSDKALYIHQDAKLSIGSLDKGKKISYSVTPQNGAYIFVIKGNIEVDNEKLNEKDAIAISDTKTIDIAALSDSEILVIDVTLN